MNGFVIDLHTTLSSSDVYLWDLQLLVQFVISLCSVLSPCDGTLLHSMCTCGSYSYSSISPCDETLLHPTCTYGTCSYSSVTLSIRHKSLRSILFPYDMYLWDPSPSDLWNPMAPFSISFRTVGPNGFCVTCSSVGSDGTFLHHHPTCGTRRLTCGTFIYLHPTCGT
jgi:hypothetical protein